MDSNEIAAKIEKLNLRPDHPRDAMLASAVRALWEIALQLSKMKGKTEESPRCGGGPC